MFIAQDDGALGMYVVSLFLYLAIYLAPSIVAKTRKIKNFAQVFIVNFFLGWTLIGWVVALVMAFKPIDPKDVVVRAVGGSVSSCPKCAFFSTPGANFCKECGSAL